MSRGNGANAELSDTPRLPDGWSWSRLDSVCDIAVGFAFKSAEFATHGIRLLRGENLEPGAFRWSDVRHWPEEKVSGYEHLFVREGDIIHAMDRPVISSGLKIAYAKSYELPCLLVQRMARLRVEQMMTSQFAYAVMQTQRFINHLQGGQTGTQLPHVSTKGIGTFPIPVPPLNEQRRIVGKIEELFSDLEAGVAALTRARANLKRYRASVLKAAVEGALTAEWRTQGRSPAFRRNAASSAAERNAEDRLKAELRTVEPASKLLARILTERRRQWAADQLAKFAAAGKQPPNNWQAKYAEPAPPDTTNLPTLPDGWCWASVQQIGTVQLGRQRAPQHHQGPNMRPYLRVANVFENRIDISDVMEMNFTPAEFETYKLSFGDILLNEGQSMELIGRPAMYRDEVPGACFTNTLVRFRSMDGVDRNFALNVFLAYLKNQRFQKIATITVNIAHLGAGRFSEIEFPLPPLAEQEQIVALVSEKLSQIESAEVAIEHSLRRAARVRQSILKQAFEGKLVPQDPTDEPASTLLERIQNSPARDSSRRHVTR